MIAADNQPFNNSTVSSESLQKECVKEPAKPLNLPKEVNNSTNLQNSQNNQRRNNFCKTIIAIFIFAAIFSVLFLLWIKIRNENTNSLLENSNGKFIQNASSQKNSKSTESTNTKPSSANNKPSSSSQPAGKGVISSKSGGTGTSGSGGDGEDNDGNDGDKNKKTLDTEKNKDGKSTEDDSQSEQEEEDSGEDTIREWISSRIGESQNQIGAIRHLR